MELQRFHWKHDDNVSERCWSASLNVFMSTWTGMTLLNASLVLASPHITHPVIRSRQVQAICFFLELICTSWLKNNCLNFHFQEWTTLQHAPACSSGHSPKEKAVHSLVHVTISELASTFLDLPSYHRIYALSPFYTRDAFLLLLTFWQYSRLK